MNDVYFLETMLGGFTEHLVQGTIGERGSRQAAAVWGTSALVLKPLNAPRRGGHKRV